VADIAIQNGGGGHKNAAGFKSKLTFDEAYKHAVDTMTQLFKNKM
jgi:nanoRNase/pAp phosphatase (c-di-AMP/oligoRNAs hydrolase)